MGMDIISEFNHTHRSIADFEEKSGVNLPENIKNMLKRKSSDKAVPLLALAGTLECDEENISDRHDELIGDGLLAELRRGADE